VKAVDYIQKAIKRGKLHRFVKFILCLSFIKLYACVPRTLYTSQLHVS